MKLRPPIEVYESLDREIEQHLEREYKMAKKAKLGSGARFREVEASATKSGATNPAGVAAAIGRKKYGAKKMLKMASTGKRHSK